jgi:hypothetical protein
MTAGSFLEQPTAATVFAKLELRRGRSLISPGLEFTTLGFVFRFSDATLKALANRCVRVRQRFQRYNGSLSH